MIAFKKVLFGRLAKKEASRFVFRTRYGVASVAWKPGFEPSRGGWIREINSWRKGKKERKRERREVEGDGGGGSSRLLRSSSASDDKSELRPRTRWHDGVVGPWTCKRDGRLWACSSGGALEGCLVSGGELYSATSLVPRRLIARNNRTKSRTNDNFHRECQRCGKEGRVDGNDGEDSYQKRVTITPRDDVPSPICVPLLSITMNDARRKEAKIRGKPFTWLDLSGAEWKITSNPSRCTRLWKKREWKKSYVLSCGSKPLNGEAATRPVEGATLNVVE